MRQLSRGFSPFANTASKSSRLSIARSLEWSLSLRWVIDRARSRAPQAMPAFPARSSALRQRPFLGGGLEAFEHHLPVTAERVDRLLVRLLSTERRLAQLNAGALALGSSCTSTRL